MLYPKKGSLNGFKGTVFSLLLLALLFLPTSGAAIGLEEGDAAKGFAGVDLLGNEVDVGPLIGKQVIILKFGSIYCSSCVQSIVDLAELQKTYPEDQLKVVGINLDIYGTFRVKRFYRQNQELLNFPILIDKNLDVSRIYGVATLPSIVIIGTDGKILRKMVGYQEDELETILQFARKLTEKKDVTELVGLLPEKERAFNIILPTNFTKTQQSEINIVGIAEKIGTRIRLTLNGGSQQELVTKRPIFYFRTPISLGSNYIEVSVQTEGGGKQSQAVVLFRDPKIGQGFPTQFPTYSFHLRENEEKCLECHDLTSAESSGESFMMITQICLECHVEFSQKLYVHGPITVGGCSPCHDFSSEPERYRLFSAGSELCYGCHEEKRTDFARTYVHGPLAAGVCSICHSPHASNEKYNLRLPQGQMCLLCHQQIKEISYLDAQHTPFEDGQCSGCHNPHSSDNEKFFLRANDNDLCALCHNLSQMEDHRHPVGVVPTASFPEMKLTEEGETMCSSCHSPHATNAEFLLPDKGCPTCHSY